MDKKGGGGGGGRGESGKGGGGGAGGWRRKWWSSVSDGVLVLFFGFCSGRLVAYRWWHHFLLPSSGRPVILSSTWLTQWKRCVSHEPRHKGAHCGVISKFLRLTFQKIGDVFSAFACFSPALFHPAARNKIQAMDLHYTSAWILTAELSWNAPVGAFPLSVRGGATASMLALMSRRSWSAAAVKKSHLAGCERGRNFLFAVVLLDGWKTHCNSVQSNSLQKKKWI